MSRTWLVVVSSIVITWWNHVSLAERFNGVEFPLGVSSFADTVLVFDPLYSGGPAPSFFFDPTWALGPPGTEMGAMDHNPLGKGGLIELGFTDNLLINSGDVAPDLYVGEVGGTAEDFFLALLPTAATDLLLGSQPDQNDDGYLELDRFIGSYRDGSSAYVSLIDIDAYFPGFGPGVLQFVAVQVIDDPTRGSHSGGTAGMDLESVGAISSVAMVPGDVNLDGSLNVHDLDTLTQGILHGSTDPLLDLNRDKTVDDDDRAMWIHDLKHTYFGDANLDGEFNTGDFVQVFEAGKYETQQYAGWAEGDWNSDGVFDTGDFVIAFADGGYEKGPQVGAAAVPEPSSVLLLVTGLIAVAICARRHRS